MSSRLVRTIALAAALGTAAAGTAQAAIGDGILGANAPLARIAPVEDVQFLFGGRNYCWYDDGWSGPGWYWCGYAFRQGLGWGGGEGFRGWGHGGRGRPGFGGGHRPGFGGGHGGGGHGRPAGGHGGGHGGGGHGGGHKH